MESEVKEALETADYLKRCADEGLQVLRTSDGTWHLGKPYVEPFDAGGTHGPTLREAYDNYKALCAVPE